ncbi:trifunctional serine/threonine-protein kinase/ATP-binding protein/sensor histidine kinase [Paraburkholderia sediminicola]|uniref:trifunctional serine/threonine-protein kinase/ATP-binding protein/sensor histidine kinase n=1 Tax=Paraburkholderia sediminicola TaxID=458836 RepID=UPI0038B9CC11
MSGLLDAYLELVCIGQETILHRARIAGEQTTVLVRSPAPSCPYELRLSLLERELALCQKLEPIWSARPISLERIAGEPRLVLHDPGGATLDQWLASSPDFDSLLRISVVLTSAVGKMHACGLVHRNIKPENILVDESLATRLTGFGLATAATAQPPTKRTEIIAGTLAYMSPEQTGRLDRGVDARSDLYSLGVVLYRMFTDRLPFEATDPLGWIHCHVAQRPAAPGDIAAVSGQLSRIILKLLAKPPEDRYQTAAALEADLRLCIANLTATGEMGDFPLGHHDVASRLLAPDGLYGRDTELASLSAIWQRVLAGGAELVLLSGHSGVGKSTVVREFQKGRDASVLFASGKCDQHKQGIPYAALAQALQQLVRHVLSLPAAEAAAWRQAATDTLGANGQIMINLIPELESLIGPQPDLVSIPPRDAQSRFQCVFTDLLAVFATLQRPLILFLDDLQWLDQPTLTLIEHLATSGGIRRLMFIGTYRSNEVGRGHALTIALRGIRRCGASLSELSLKPLRREDVVPWLADALSSGDVDILQMAAIAHAKTGGNPLALIQFFGELLQERLIAVVPETGGWTSDLDNIRRRPFTDNMAAVMLARLRALPAVTQRTLETLACLGATAPTSTLALLLGTDEARLHASLISALDDGLAVRTDEGYAFVHDRIQEAAYAAIDSSAREARHLAIAQAITAQRPLPEHRNFTFDIVHQYNLAVGLIVERCERDRVAELNLAAAETAMAVMGHSSAADYLAKGLSLLGDDAWLRCYHLAFPLSLRLAECRAQLGDYPAANAGLESLLGRAANLIDLAAVCRTQADLFTMLGQFDRAVTVGLHYLQRVGFDCPASPGIDDVRREVDRLRAQQGSRTIEAMATLASMEAPVPKATMNLLARVLPAALYTDRHLHSILVVRMANLTLEYGYTDTSSLAYIMLSRVLGPYFDDYDEGFRFGRLGFDAVESRGPDQLRASAYLCYAVFCNVWTNPARSSVPLLERALTAARTFGDVTYAAYSYNNLVANLLLTGEWLGDVERTTEDGVAFATTAKFRLGELILRTQLDLVRALRGTTPDMTILGDGVDAETTLRNDIDNQAGFELPLCWFWIRKLQACVIAGDYVTAVYAARRAEPLLWVCAEFVELAEFHFYAALAAAQCGNENSGTVLDVLRGHQRRLQTWALNCPETFENRAALVNAEIARLEHRQDDAEVFYEQAVRSARRAGFPHNEALAAEFAARFHAARGLETIAEAYLRKSRDGYMRWGAIGKVRKMEAQSLPLRPAQGLSRSAECIHTAIEELDVDSIVRASQAVSGEILLEDLIGALMKITLEQAGADRAILMLQRAGNLVPAAEAQRTASSVAVSLQMPRTASDDIPASILHTVARTRSSVLLDDAQRSDDFSQDAYVRTLQPRSVLCLPLLKQGELVGVLYLENRLTAGVFSPRRTAVLEVLASQAAISLENARLYAELVDENNERRRAEAALRESEASLALGQEISQTGSWRWNTSTNETFWSLQLCRMLEFDATERSPNIGVVVKLTHPDDRDYAAEVRAQAVAAWRGFTYEYRVRLPSGALKHLFVIGLPDGTDERGLFYVGTVVDITERKQTEEALRLAQAELAQAARMTTLGEIAASIAHEVNQPLTAMVANANACQRWLADEKMNLTKAREMARCVARDGLRASEIIRSIRALAKNNALSIAELDVNEALEDILAIVAGDLERHKVLVEVNLDAGLPLIQADRVQLRQVFVNLIRNGLEALTQWTGLGRTIRISSRLEMVDHVLLTIEDNGPGIDSSQRERIFEPFFTTKEDGMGMGLSICRSIVTAHGGNLSVKSADPHGCVFEILLPVSPPLP